MNLADDMAEAHARRIPFSLSCFHCDMDPVRSVTSVVSAIRYGWSKLQLATDMPQCNWLGECPDYDPFTDRCG